MSILQELAETLSLGALLEEFRARWGSFELVAHWKQGEFHHDIVVRVPQAASQLLGTIFVASIDCNGGLKELLLFDEVPDRWALWHFRCPQSAEFGGELPPLLGRKRTVHHIDPSELLVADTRNELQPELRQYQASGWEPSYH